MRMTSFLNDPFMMDESKWKTFAPRFGQKNVSIEKENVKNSNNVLKNTDSYIDSYGLKQKKSFVKNYNGDNNENNRQKYIKHKVKNYLSKNLFEYNNAHAEGYFFSNDNAHGIQNWESYHNYYRGNVEPNNNYDELLDNMELNNNYDDNPDNMETNNKNDDYRGTMEPNDNNDELLDNMELNNNYDDYPDNMEPNNKNDDYRGSVKPNDNYDELLDNMEPNKNYDDYPDNMETNNNYDDYPDNVEPNSNNDDYPDAGEVVYAYDNYPDSMEPNNNNDDYPDASEWEDVFTFYPSTENKDVLDLNVNMIADTFYSSTETDTFYPSNQNKEVLNLNVNMIAKDVKENIIDDVKIGKILHKITSSKTFKIRQPKKNETKLNEIIRKKKPLMRQFKSKNKREQTFLKRLFQKEVNEKGYGQKTALHESAKNKKCPPSITRLLLLWGSDVDAKDAKKCTALHYAAKTGNTQKVYALIKNDANVNIFNKERFTPLHIACQYGHLSVAKMLLENGAWVNVKNWYNYTPLHFACENYCDGMVYLLLDYGAHLFARTAFGKTALLRAVKFGHVGDIALLLEMDFCGPPFDKNEWVYILLTLSESVEKQTYFDTPKNFLMKF